MLERNVGGSVGECIESPPCAGSRWLRYSRTLLLAAAALVPLSISYVPFAGIKGVFAGSSTIPVQSAALGVLVGAALGCWAVAVQHRELTSRKVPHAALLVAFGALVVLSTFTALEKRAAVFGYDYAEQGLLTYVGYFAAFFLVTQVVRDRGDLLRLMQAMVGSAGVVASFGVLQVVGLPFFPTELEWHMTARGSSTLGNPDMLGTFLVLPLLMSLGLVLATRGGRRWMWLALSSVIAVSLLLTQTRGAWLGALVGVVVFAATLNRSRHANPALGRTLGIGAALLGAATALVAAYKAAIGAQPLFWRVAETFAGADADGGRMLVWTESLRVLRVHPVLGVGPDNLLFGWFGVTQNAHVPLMGIDGIIADAHSYWLGVMVSSGIVAGMLLLWFVASVLWGSRRVAVPLDGQGPSSEQVAYAALWAGTAGLSVALVFAVSVTPIGLFFWLALGMLLVPAVTSVENTARRPGALRASAAIGALVIGLLLVAWGGLTSLSANREYIAAESRAEQLEAVRTAQRMAPWRTHPVSLELTLMQYDEMAPSATTPVADRLIAMSPLNYGYYTIKAGILLQADPQQVVATADAGLAVYPRGLRLTAQRALARALLGQTDAAVSDAAMVWDASQDVVPHRLSAMPGITYAQVLGLAGRYDEAREVATRLEEEFPSDPSVAALRSSLDTAQQTGH